MSSVPAMNVPRKRRFPKRVIRRHGRYIRFMATPWESWFEVADQLDFSDAREVTQAEASEFASQALATLRNG